MPAGVGGGAALEKSDFVRPTRGRAGVGLLEVVVRPFPLDVRYSIAHHDLCHPKHAVFLDAFEHAPPLSIQAGRSVAETNFIEEPIVPTATARSYAQIHPNHRFRTQTGTKKRATTRRSTEFGNSTPMTFPTLLLRYGHRTKNQPLIPPSPYTATAAGGGSAQGSRVIRRDVPGPR